MPFTESQKLFAAARPHIQARLTLLRVVGHVDPSASDLKNALAFAADVLDLWGVAYVLLSL